MHQQYRPEGDTVNRYDFSVGKKVQGRLVLNVAHGNNQTIILTRDTEDGRFSVEIWKGDQQEASNGWYDRGWFDVKALFREHVESLLYETQMIEDERP